MDGKHAVIALALAGLLAGCLGDGAPSGSYEPRESVGVNEDLLADVPTWRVGDNWVYLTQSFNMRNEASRGYHRELVTGTGIERDGRIVYEVTTFTGDAAGGPWTFASMKYVDAETLSDVTGNAGYLRIEWPLSTGAVWTSGSQVFRVNGPSVAYVPAGAFHVASISFGAEGALIPEGQVAYAPDARNVVNLKHRVEGNSLERVLVSYHLSS